MTDKTNETDGTPIPSRRLSRLAGLGGLAVNLAGGMALKGAKQLATGQRPKITDLILTPKNALKITWQLSNMRGAAMKIGQMISMESGDFLPKEFADILAQLRSDARNMPKAQLQKVLTSEWGHDWLAQFAYFKHYPIAAASIGQVHRAETHDGDVLAIKVQYPGVRESIDSDVNNVASLLSMTGLVPAHLDIKPLIEEGRKQLHQEADYLREAKYLQQFAALVSDDAHFAVPEYYPDLSTDRVLAMSYIESHPIEELVDAPQEVRNQIVSRLFKLLLRELFEFQLMQTDPNFANYRFNPDTDQIVLLDFGATREIDTDLVEAYRNMVKTVLYGDSEDCLNAAIEMGFAPNNIPPEFKSVILEIIDIALVPIRRDAPYDFRDTQIATDIRDKAMDLALKRDLWHLPPPETVFIQRKIGGMFMLATRLMGQVNVHALLKNYIGDQI